MVFPLFIVVKLSLWAQHGYKKTTCIGGFSSRYCSETIIVGTLSLQQLVMYQQSIEIMMMVVLKKIELQLEMQMDELRRKK